MENSEFHIIINVQGTHGDLHPMIGLARALADLNYQVSILANDVFADFIAANGLAFTSLGTEEQHFRYYGDQRVWNPEQNQLDIYFDEMTRQSIKIGYDYVIAASRTRKKIIVVTFDVIANGSGMAADVLRLPRIRVSLAPAAIPSARWFSPFPWLPARIIPFHLRSLLYQKTRKKNDCKALEEKVLVDLNAIRRSYGLDKCCFSEPITQILHLGFFPEWFAMRQPDWPTDIRLVGFPLFDHIKQARHSEVSRFIADRGRPIVFTSGSGVAEAEELFRQGRQICEILKLPGIFVGSTLSKFIVEKSPDCLHVDYIDFETLLPQCLALVHHGGIGTTAQAIKAGIPQIVRPITFDQPDNGYRVFLLGLGACVSPNKFTAKKVSAILKAVLRRVPNNRQLIKYSHELKRGSAIQRACDIIDATLRKHFTEG